MNTKALRKEFQLTQQDLADATGIPKGRINAWEQRNSKPKTEDFFILSTYFNSLREQQPHSGQESLLQAKIIALEQQIIELQQTIVTQKEIINTLKEIISPNK